MMLHMRLNRPNDREPGVVARRLSDTRETRSVRIQLHLQVI